MKPQIIHFLHIGKTGGTALRTTLRKNKSKKYKYKFHRHNTTLKEVPEGEKVIFLIRDPLTKFISGFYSRQRKGRPRYNSAWGKVESKAFKKFKIANELAEAITSKEPKTKKEAINAMKNIMHVKSFYWDWFGNEKYFIKRIPDILFIGRQEKLNKDFERLKKILGIPKKVKLPTDKIKMHKNPENLDTYLTKTAKKNLEKWYAKDYKFLSLLKKRKLI